MTKGKMPVESQLPIHPSSNQPGQVPIEIPSDLSTSTQSDLSPDSPPPYTPSESHSSTAGATSSSPADMRIPLPPPDAQRARAPLEITNTNRSIKGAFLILHDDTSKSSAPDAYFRTTNGSIATSIWFEKATARPVGVEAWTTNASIDLSVHPPRTQQVAISATSTNGKIRMRLHSSFHGLLTVSTTNSTHTLSPELQARSVRVSHDVPGDSHAVTYEIGGPDGMSTAKLKTTNSKIEVGLEGDATADSRSDENKCLVC